MGTAELRSMLIVDWGMTVQDSRLVPWKKLEKKEARNGLDKVNDQRPIAIAYMRCGRVEVFLSPLSHKYFRRDDSHALR